MSGIPNTEGQQPAFPGAGGSLPILNVSDDPQAMPAEYIAQLTHELYARTGMYPESRELHEHAMAIKAEVTRRLVRLEQLEADVRRMDWMEGHPHEVPWAKRWHGPLTWFAIGSSALHRSLREAVDASMREANK